MAPRALRLVLLCALLGLVVWLVVLRGRKPETLDLAGWAAPAWVMEADTVRYENAGEVCVVERQGDGFTIVRPFRDRADPTRVLQSLQAATRLRPSRVLESVDPADYGLRPPGHRFVVVDAAGTRWSMAFGDTVPVGGQIYAGVEDEPHRVLLLGEFSARRDFFPDPQELRDRVSLPLRGPVVDSLWVLTEAGPLRAVRDAREAWTAREPAGLELDPLPINRVLRELRLPTLREFLPEETPLEAGGLAPPRATWVAFQEGRAETVQVGAPTTSGDGIHLLPSGRRAIAVLPADIHRPLLGGWPALASRRLTFLEARTIGRIEFPGTDAAYARSDSGWARDPGGAPVRNPRALLHDLDNLLALQWENYPVKPLTPGPDAETVTLRLIAGMDVTGAGSAAATEERHIGSGDDSAAPVEVLTLARSRIDGSVLARSDRRPLWGRVPGTQFDIWSYRRTHPDL